MKFRFIPYPSQEELGAIAELVGLSLGQLEAMLPQESMKLLPIRLCAPCYREKPYHTIEWQYQSRLSCDVHGVKLLTKCPSCRQPFEIPSRWINGRCTRCGMLFRNMDKRLI